MKKQLFLKDLEKGGRYLLNSYSQSPFKINGVLSYSSFIERGDVVDLGFHRLEFKPQNEEEIYEYATKERFQKYCNGRKSLSMMDHYYDRLIHIARPPVNIIKNKYLQSIFMSRYRPIIIICLIYSSKGDEGVLEYLNSLKRNKSIHT